MNKLFLSVAFLALAAGAAQAADPVMPIVDPVIDVPAFDWSGFYVGLHGGGSWGTVNTEFDLDPPGPAFVPVAPYSISGGVFGAQAGVLMQTGKFVLGAEGRVSWVGTRGTNAAAPVADTFDANWSASALGKVGVALGERGRVLPYFIGGVTGLGYDYTLSGGGVAQTVTATAVGGTIGGGVEIAVTERFSIFGEYTHTFYGTNGLVFTAGAPIMPQRDNVRSSIGTALVGFNFRL